MNVLIVVFVDGVFALKTPLAATRHVHCGCIRPSICENMKTMRAIRFIFASNETNSERQAVALILEVR
jgi:hypothetical protein